MRDFVADLKSQYPIINKAINLFNNQEFLKPLTRTIGKMQFDLNTNTKEVTLANRQVVDDAIESDVTALGNF